MPARYLLLGTRKALIALERAGGRWKLAFEAHPGIGVPYAATDPRDGTLWVSLEHGHWGPKLARSADAGRTWEQVPPPAYPAGSELKPGVPASLRLIWTVVPGPASQPGRLYLGTDPGGLFVSEDGGKSFALVRGLWDHPSRIEHWFGGGRDQPGVHSLVFDPRDDRHLWAGISCAGVFETRDGGATWEPKNRGLVAEFLPDPHAEVGHDPHFLAGCPAHPEVLWQQNHCGIFKSADGARSWTKVSAPDVPAHFGFAIACAADPGVAWVVPATSDEHRVAVKGALCVSRTTDGGKSWTALRKGLPQELAWDVVFRHALDHSDGALAFGSTTGNAWFSADGGDSWECLGHHFPPIYSVRFAERLGR